MSSTKIGEASQQEEASSPMFSSAEADKAAKAQPGKVRGSNVTPKTEMHTGRNWSHLQWEQAFRAFSAKLDRQTYSKKATTK